MVFANLEKPPPQEPHLSKPDSRYFGRLATSMRSLFLSIDDGLIAVFLLLTSRVHHEQFAKMVLPLSPIDALD